MTDDNPGVYFHYGVYPREGMSPRTRSGAGDGLGSVAALSHYNNQISKVEIAERYRYDAFGQTQILSPNDELRTTSLYGNPYLFTGRRWDAETGLYYYRARIYNPALGRFMQTDPIGYYDTMNLYQYAFNSPTNYLDPSGLSAKEGESEKIRLYNDGFMWETAPVDYTLSQYRSPYDSPEMRAKVDSVMAWVAVTEHLTMAGYATYYAAKPVKVGRWMSEEEYKAMNKSGYVQKGGGNTTYVTRPSNPAAYTASDPGTIFVEFRVSPADLRPGGKSSWNQIPGPGNIYCEKSVGGSIR